MNKTDDILERLSRQQQPVIDNPDELTDMIIDQLPEQDAPQKEHSTKPSAILITLRVISSIAAIWLVGLFFYQQSSVSAPDIPTNEVPHHISHFSSGSTLKDVYTSRQQRDQLISYTQLRQMRYENK
jgi:hypothetical protein